MDFARAGGSAEEAVEQCRHCEKRSDEAIQQAAVDLFGWLTISRR
jgi:hypothetical protein